MKNAGKIAAISIMAIYVIAAGFLCGTCGCNFGKMVDAQREGVEEVEDGTK